MLTTKRYESLVEMLNNAGYNVSEFINSDENAYFMLRGFNPLVHIQFKIHKLIEYEF